METTTIQKLVIPSDLGPTATIADLAVFVGMLGYYLDVADSVSRWTKEPKGEGFEFSISVLGDRDLAGDIWDRCNALAMESDEFAAALSDTAPGSPAVSAADLSDLALHDYWSGDAIRRATVIEAARYLRETEGDPTGAVDGAPYGHTGLVYMVTDAQAAADAKDREWARASAAATVEAVRQQSAAIRDALAPLWQPLQASLGLWDDPEGLAQVLHPSGALVRAALGIRAAGPDSSALVSAVRALGPNLCAVVVAEIGAIGADLLRQLQECVNPEWIQDPDQWREVCELRLALGVLEEVAIEVDGSGCADLGHLDDYGDEVLIVHDGVGQWLSLATVAARNADPTLHGWWIPRLGELTE